MTTRKFFYYGKYVLWGILGIAAVAGFGFIIMWLWNWLVPELFSGPVINYWQTIGLLLLSKILFSGVGHSQPRRHYDYRHKDYWRKKCEERMNRGAEGTTAESV